MPVASERTLSPGPSRASVIRGAALRLVIGDAPDGSIAVLAHEQCAVLRDLDADGAPPDLVV